MLTHSCNSRRVGCATGFLLLLAQLAQSETARTHIYVSPAERILTFAGVKPGQRIADFLPASAHFIALFCKAVGDTGHVYSISIPGHLPIESSSVAACMNITADTLRSRNFPAPELHSDSDDPGWVYEYYAPRLPVESFTTPEPLDLIWMSDRFGDLRDKSMGPPNVTWVMTALLTALKPGGVLIVEDKTIASRRIDAEQVKKAVTAAGFEFLGVAVDYNESGRFLIKFRRPL